MSAYILLIETYEILGSIARKNYCSFDVIGYFIKETNLLRLFSIFDWRFPQFLPLVKNEGEIKSSKYIRRIVKLQLSSLSEITLFRKEAEYEEESFYSKYINKILRGCYKNTSFSDCKFGPPKEIYYNPRVTYCCHPYASKVMTSFITSIESNSSSKTIILKNLYEEEKIRDVMKEENVNLLYKAYELFKEIKDNDLPVIDINVLCRIFGIEEFPDYFLKNCLISGSGKETLTIPLRSDDIYLTISLKGARLSFIDKAELKHMRDYLSSPEFEHMKYDDLRNSIDIELTK